MNNQKKLIVMIMALSLILIISSSYALLRSSKTGKNNYVINVGDLEVTFKDGQTEKLSLTNIEPISDEEGMAQEDVLSFTIENTGTIGSYYNISIEELSNNPEFKSVIKYISSKDNEGYSEPKILKDDKYIDFRGYIEAGATRTYKIKAWLMEEADNTYMKKEFKAKIVINAIQNTNEYDLYDRSGNNYNAKFMNGAKIVTDENSRKAIFFDGEDDYVEIDDLPATINFADGFTIEFEATWEKFNFWSRVIDIGNGEGSDNILVANIETSGDIRADMRYDRTIYYEAVPNVVTLNEKIKLRIEHIKNADSFSQNTYKNDALIYSANFKTQNFVRNILRTSNYLGKSNWEADGYFNGLIYYLKITDSKGNPIIWYDANF